MFPVVGSGTTRRSMEQDMTIGGGKLFVPKGVLVWIPMHAVQNVAANWDQPDKFMPERWETVCSILTYHEQCCAQCNWHKPQGLAQFQPCCEAADKLLHISKGSFSKVCESGM